jgi:branched-chain amino acid transport system permease protein
VAAARWIVVAVLALLAPQVLNLFWTGLLIQIVVFGLFALSVDLLVGHTGILPMGHAAFFAVAAYTTAILEVRHGMAFLPAAAAGVAAAVALAAFFGIAVRTTGVYFILVTLAMGHVVWGVLMRWTTVTGGENGVSNVPPPVLGPLQFTSLSTYYYLAVPLVVLCTLGYRVLVRSPFGLTLHGIRESEGRMRGLGYRTRAHKFAAFVLSGFLAGVAGVLYVHWNRFVSPATANFIVSAEVVLMVCIGGPRTILGPFLGSAIILAIRNYLSGYLMQWMMVMGAVFIATVLWAPEGVVGLGRRLRAARGAARRVPKARAVPAQE